MVVRLLTSDYWTGCPIKLFNITFCSRWSLSTITLSLVSLGYPSGSRVSQVEPVYIVDLAGLQFQQAYNSGRLVLSKDKLPHGLLDNFIYEKVVGEKRRSFQEIQTEHYKEGADSRRYSKYVCPRSGHNVDAFFDSKVRTPFT